MDAMMDFEISLSISAAGWHWTIMKENNGRRVLVAESDRPFKSAVEAAAEAEAYIGVGDPNGMNVAFMPWLSKQYPWTVRFRREPMYGFATRDEAEQHIEARARHSAKASA